MQVAGCEQTRVAHWMRVARWYNTVRLLKPVFELKCDCATILRSYAEAN